MAQQGLTLHGFRCFQAVQPVLICCGLIAVPRSVCLILAQWLCGTEGQVSLGSPSPWSGQARDTPGETCGSQADL